jgi:hypothetical protein
VQSVSEEFLLSLAGASATLMGAFLVGVIFYLDSDTHRSMSEGLADDSFMRSAMRSVFVIFAIPLMVPLTLVGLGASWGMVVFVGFGALTAASTVNSVYRILMSGIVKSMSPTQSVALTGNQIVFAIAVALLISLPWLLDGWTPQTSAFVPSLLLALAVGFSSTAALVMSIFDLSKGMRDSSA